MDHSAHVGSGGPVAIPARLRKAIGLRTGVTVIIRLAEDGLAIATPERAARAAQALVEESAPDHTADRTWQDVDAGIPIHAVR